MEGKALAGVWNGLGFVDHQACDGHRLFIGQIPVHRAIEVANWHRPIDIDRTIWLGAHALYGDVMLIHNIADDFF